MWCACRWRAFPVLLLLSRLSSTVLDAGGGGASARTMPAQKCAVAKMQLVGRLARDLAGCASTAGSCTATAFGALDGRWTKLDSRGGCGSVGDRGAIETLTTGFATEIATALDEGRAPTQCGSKQRAVAGKALRCALGCHAKAMRAGTTVGASCLAGCTAAFALQC